MAFAGGGLIFVDGLMTTLAIDPVCGMRVDEAEALGPARFEARTFYFCSELCKSRFDADPERYAVGSGTVDARP
jgi:YHS domain-containing protein